MRVLQISHLYQPYVLGGVEVYLGHLLPQLAAHVDVTLLTTMPFNGPRSLRPERSVEKNVRVLRVFPLNVYHQTRRPKSKTLKALWQVLDIYNLHARWIVERVAEEVNPDVVHTHNLRGLSVSVWNAAGLSATPLVHTAHDYHLLSRNSTLTHGRDARLCDGGDFGCRFYRGMMRRAIRRMPDVLLAPSRWTLERHEAAGVRPTWRGYVLPLWADAEPWAAEGTSSPKTPLKILYMGTVSRHKGVRYLVSAFLKQSDAADRLEIVGGGDEELETCRQLAAGDGRIRFIGFLSGREKEAAFQRANIVAVPSIWYENSPVVIYESLARGKAVIASRIGGIPELVRDHDNGLLFEPRDVDSLAACLKILSTDAGLLDLLSRNARESARQFSSAKHVSGLLDIYRALLSSTGIPGAQGTPGTAR